MNPYMMYNPLNALLNLPSAGLAITVSILIAILAITLVVFWVQMFAHAFKHQREFKLLAWLGVVVCLHIFGAVLYFALEYYPSRNK